uniref:Uncharacterized protein n=1 Tax=Cyprinus carpio TaxID=7962 RepID=A0A8C2EWK4_CYPCA
LCNVKKSNRIQLVDRLLITFLKSFKLCDTHVTCIYSEECMLPCTSTHLDIIHWYLDKKTVHSFYHSKDQLGHQHKDYKGRTSLLSESEIKNGNKKIKRSLTAQRKLCCFGDSPVICSSRDVYPAPRVNLFTEPASLPDSLQPLTRKTADKQGLYSVESKLKKLKDLTYICLVQSFYRSQSWRASLQQKGLISSSYIAFHHCYYYMTLHHQIFP